jgi:hypothetical protein
MAEINTAAKLTSHGVLQPNVTRNLIDESFTGSGTVSRSFVVTGSSMTVALFVRSIASGSLTLTISTYVGSNISESKEVIDIPVQTDETENLLIFTTTVPLMSKILVTATHEDDVNFVLSAKPLKEDNSEATAIEDLIEGTTSLKLDPNQNLYVYDTKVHTLLESLISHIGVLIKHNEQITEEIINVDDY